MPSASRVRWAKFRVASVCVLAVLILATLSYLLTGGTLLEAKATIYLYVPDATGLAKDSPVRVDGIDVGKVSKVELSGQNDPNRIVRVTMTIERDRLNSMTADSFAEISSDSLIGDKFVDVTSQKSTEHIPPNGELHLKPPSDIMKNMDLPQFEAQLRSIDALLTDIEAGQSPVGQLVMGSGMYSGLLASVGRIQKAFHAAISTTTAVGDALSTDRIYNQVAGPMAAMDQSLAGMQAQLRDSTQYAAALKQLEDLRGSIAEVRASPMMQSDQMYRDLDRMLVGFIQQVNQMDADPMLNSTAMYESLAGMAKETGDTMKVFREDPRKFLRLKVF